MLLFACLECIYWENRAKEGGFNPPLYFFKKLYYNIYRKLKKGCGFMMNIIHVWYYFFEGGNGKAPDLTTDSFIGDVGDTVYINGEKKVIRDYAEETLDFC